MKNLLYKEFRLVLHPTTLIFLALSAMLLIPNYPYCVVFFYTCLGVFFTCLSGRENHDIFYTVSLPIRKRDMVKARFAYVALIQLAQMVIAVPFALLRAQLGLGGNAAGLDANIALFGVAFILLGVFNYVFFTHYYKAPDKVGGAFNRACIVFTLLMILAEGSSFAVPFVRSRLDTPDPQFAAEKLTVLAVGLVLYAAFTLLAYKKSVKSFEGLDL